MRFEEGMTLGDALDVNQELLATGGAGAGTKSDAEGPRVSGFRLVADDELFDGGATWVGTKFLGEPSVGPIREEVEPAPAGG
jgi:hypothetical protein